MTPDALHKAGQAAFKSATPFDITMPLAWRNGYRLAWFLAGCPIRFNLTPLGE